MMYARQEVFGTSVLRMRIVALPQILHILRAYSWRAHNTRLKPYKSAATQARQSVSPHKSASVPLPSTHLHTWCLKSLLSLTLCQHGSVALKGRVCAWASCNALLPGRNKLLGSCVPHIMHLNGITWVPSRLQSAKPPDIYTSIVILSFTYL